MPCISPMSIRRKGSVESSASDRVTIPCGKCIGCLSRKRAEWSVRLYQELLSSETALFVTLTYDEENEPWCYRNYPLSALPFKDAIKEDDFSDRVPTLDKKGFTEWFKRFRWAVNNDPNGNNRHSDDNGLRYFVTGEYGSKYGRPHYHMLLFNFPFEMSMVSKYRSFFIDFAQKYIQDSWKQGHVEVGDVTGASIFYTAKYCITKSSVPSTVAPVFTLMSRRPGIGYSYLSSSIIDYHKEGLKNYYLKDGFKVTLPRYYKDKIFNELEKETIKADIEVLNSRDYVDKLLNCGLKDLEFERVNFERKVNFDIQGRKNLSKSDKL